jgi:DNA replication licensing factor MCM5
MDRQSVFSSRLYGAPTESEDSNTHIRALLESFILDFRLDNIFIYRSASQQYTERFFS